MKSTVPATPVVAEVELAPLAKFPLPVRDAQTVTPWTGLPKRSLTDAVTTLPDTAAVIVRASVGVFCPK